MMQEAGSGQMRSLALAVRQWITCVFAYGFIWACTLNLLWFLASNGVETFRHPADSWRLLLVVAANLLCPEWTLLVAGIILGLLTCICLPKLGGAVKSSLLWGLLPAAAILAMFGFTASGFLPALLAVAASCLAGTVIAHTWQQPLFSVPFSGRSLVPKQVIIILIWLLALSIPFRLFELLGMVWSQVLPAKITEARPVVPSDRAYMAVIHNVDPNINDYSDVVIRPRHPYLNLFTGSSASTRLYGVDKIEWLDRRTLRVWGDFRPRAEQWYDVRILYSDTADPQERQERDALRRDAEGR